MKGVHQRMVVGNLKYHKGLTLDLDLHVLHLVEHVKLQVRICFWN